MWRVSYGELNNLTNDELLARQPAKFKAFLPGHPDPDKYKIANISPYKIHQRLAKKMRVGKFLLAADAAHLCNPL
jgi:2-polyprenyl-6-methoxyphenol hydroxylase-like FAD-dependent oxidoreductase